MIEKIKKFFQNIFSKNKVLLLDKPKDALNNQELIEKEDKAKDFKIQLRKQTYLNQDDGNGYGIIRNINLEDLI